MKKETTNKQENVLPGQLGRIFNYMKNNKAVTGLELWRNCGAMSWAKKISVLNEILPSMGYAIAKKRIEVYSKFAQKYVWVMEYTLVKLEKKDKKTKRNKKSK